MNLEITDLSQPIEIGPHQSAYLEVQILGDRKTFVVTDFEKGKQDLCLSVWFSRVPFEDNIRFKNYMNRKNVQRLKPLIVSIKDETLVDAELQVDSFTVEQPEGTYYLNIQNLSGSYKIFQLSVFSP
jgi:hypothetical protein